MPHVGENTGVFTGNLARLQCPIVTRSRINGGTTKMAKIGQYYNEINTVHVHLPVTRNMVRRATTSTSSTNTIHVATAESRSHIHLLLSKTSRPARPKLPPYMIKTKINSKSPGHFLLRSLTCVVEHVGTNRMATCLRRHLYLT